VYAGIFCFGQKELNPSQHFAIRFLQASDFTARPTKEMELGAMDLADSFHPPCSLLQTDGGRYILLIMNQPSQRSVALLQKVHRHHTSCYFC
jgi:hypothetical protein